MSVEAADAVCNDGRCIQCVKKTLEYQTSQSQDIGVVSTEMDDLALKFSNSSLAD
jgi:membrane-bound inhibitor of C-type lysozyme